MNDKKIAALLGKRLQHHNMFLNVSKTGHALTTDEAHELERLGLGELRGGDNGVFWLYPISGPPQIDSEGGSSEDYKGCIPAKKGKTDHLVQCDGQCAMDW